MTPKDTGGRLELLPIGDIRLHPTFQVRVNGTDTAYVRRLERVLRSGEDLPALKVARIGKALYLVGGHHRLEAYQRVRRGKVWAEVTRMSLPEAQAAALLENTDHGKAMGRADKRAHWERYVAQGGHLNPDGSLKGSTTIERELGHMYSRPTIRKRLKALGLELDPEVEFPEGYKPRDEEPEDREDLLSQDRLWEALEALERLRVEYLTLDSEHQRELRDTARAMLDAMDRSEVPAPIAVGPLDI